MESTIFTAFQLGDIVGRMAIIIKFPIKCSLPNDLDDNIGQLCCFLKHVLISGGAIKHSSVLANV